MYLFAKAMHVIGLRELVLRAALHRAAVHLSRRERRSKPEPERSILHAQFSLMERRLWKAITVPAMVVTVVFGSYLAVAYLGANRRQLHVATWLFVKLGLVGALLVYHLFCGTIRQELADGQCRWTSARLRQWNELATLLLVAIVMLAVFKSMFNAVWGTLALVGFGVLLAVAVKLVRRRLPALGLSAVSAGAALRAGVLGAEGPGRRGRRRAGAGCLRAGPAGRGRFRSGRRGPCAAGPRAAAASWPDRGSAGRPCAAGAPAGPWGCGTRWGSRRRSRRRGLRPVWYMAVAVAIGEGKKACTWSARKPLRLSQSASCTMSWSVVPGWAAMK